MRYEKVDELLELVEGTDFGARMEPEDRERANELIDQLCKRGQKRPLDDPRAFGVFEVAYTTSPTSAGGPFRGETARRFLPTTALWQVTESLDRVGNIVEFSLLGVIPGQVCLIGKLLPGEDGKWVNLKCACSPFSLPTLSLVSALSPCFFRSLGPTDLRRLSSG